MEANDMISETKTKIRAHVVGQMRYGLGDIATGNWDEVMTDALYSSCGATTRDQMEAARDMAGEYARDLILGRA